MWNRNCPPFNLQDVERGLLSLSVFCFRLLFRFRPFRSLSLVCSKHSTENAALSSCPCSAGHPVMQARRGISREQSCGQKRPIRVEERQRWPCILFQTGSPACGRGRRNVVPRLSAAARLACDGSDQGVWAPLSDSPSSPRCSRLPLAQSLPYAHALQGPLVQHSSSLLVLPLQQAGQYSQAASEASWEEFDKEGECTIENVGRGSLARRPFAALFGRQHDQPRLVTAFPHALFPLTPLHLPLSLPGNVLQLDGCRRYSMHDFDLHGRMQQ